VKDLRNVPGPGTYYLKHPKGISEGFKYGFGK
jgi:hypothetical protein